MFNQLKDEADEEQNEFLPLVRLLQEVNNDEFADSYKVRANPHLAVAQYVVRQIGDILRKELNELDENEAKTLADVMKNIGYEVRPDPQILNDKARVMATIRYELIFTETWEGVVGVHLTEEQVKMSHQELGEYLNKLILDKWDDDNANLIDTNVMVSKILIEDMVDLESKDVTNPGSEDVITTYWIDGTVTTRPVIPGVDYIEPEDMVDLESEE